MNNRMNHLTMNAVMAEDVNTPELRNPLFKHAYRETRKKHGRNWLNRLISKV